MTVQQLQKRSELAQTLRVMHDKENKDTVFYVESSKGEVCYKVTFTDKVICTCKDFANHNKTDKAFKCKHIIAVMNSIEDNNIDSVKFLKSKKPKLDERFIQKIEGKEFVRYPGLLDLAHQKGILSIEVEPLQFPNKDNGNLAICKAVVTSKIGEIFSDVGDAGPSNCNSKVAKHLLRMASTRSIGRALRSFTNISMTCLEELGDLKEVIGNNYTSKKRVVKPNTNSKTVIETPKPITVEPKLITKPLPEKKKEPVKSTSQPVKTNAQAEQSITQMSEAQARAISNLARRRGINEEDMNNMVVEMFHNPLTELNSKEASTFIRSLQQAA